MKIQAHTGDAISGNRVENLESAPFLIKGFGANVLKIYFESHNNRDELAGNAVVRPEVCCWMRIWTLDEATANGFALISLSLDNRCRGMCE